MTMDISSNILNVTLEPFVNDLSHDPYRKEYALLSTVLNFFWPVLLFAGLLSNTLNIVIFLKIGVNDSVSTLLLALSISDFFFISFFSPTILRASFSHFGTYQIFEFQVLYYLTFWPAITFYDYSAYISVFLGITRCACVAMPLRFKSVFTVKTTVAAVLILFCLDVLFHLPMLTAFRLGWVRDPSTNTTSLSLVRDSVTLHAFKQKINDIINKNLIPFVAFIIIIASVALLSFKLFESSKVRPRRYSDPSTKDTPSRSVGAKQTPSHKLSPKDVKVVQSVILVCSIFIIAQLPSVTRTIIRSSWSEFNARGRMRFLAGIFLNADCTFMMINASINVFVYYNYNRKFKSVIRSLLNLK